MKKLIIASMLLISFLLLTGCQPKVDFEKEKAEILKAYETFKQGFLEGNPEIFEPLLAEEMNIAMHGEVNKTTRAELMESLKKEAERINYLEFKDLKEPVIKFSNDGSIAWQIIQYKTKIIDKDSTGSEYERVEIWGNLLIYQKQDAKWVFADAGETKACD